MYKYLNVFFKTVRETKKARKIYLSNGYYKDVNEIPLYNWWKCLEGDLTYLWKDRKPEIPFFFKRIFHDMSYQLDYIDLDETRKLVDVDYFTNKYLVTGDIKYKRKADTKRAEYELLSKAEKTERKLNDLIKYVQLTLNLSFHIDPFVIKAGYFLNLLNEAVKRNGNN